MTAPRTSRPAQPRTTRLVHAWQAHGVDGPPLCGAPVRYRGPRPLVPPYEVCVVCADLVHQIVRKDPA